MKKTYTAPQVTVEELNRQDVLCLSDNDTVENYNQLTLLNSLLSD